MVPQFYVIECHKFWGGSNRLIQTARLPVNGIRNMLFLLRDYREKDCGAKKNYSSESSQVLTVFSHPRCWNSMASSQVHGDSGCSETLLSFVLPFFRTATGVNSLMIPNDSSGDRPRLPYIWAHYLAAAFPGPDMLSGC